MECVEIHYSMEPSYIDELHGCSFDTEFCLQNNNFISNNSILDPSSSDADAERLIQIEAHPMDFDLFDEDATMVLENVEETILCHEMIQEMQENVSFLENSHAKDSPDEMLEKGIIIDLLMQGAEAAEAENWPLASTLVARLNARLSNDLENGNIPFNRLALVFTQGLNNKCLCAFELFQEPVTKQSSTIPAFQIIQELSPYARFAHFTANQAILEATQDDPEVHVIDFDIMEGIQWPSLMIDLAERDDASLRITAIVNDVQCVGDIHQTGRRLKEFADSINLPFSFDHLVMTNKEDFEEIEVGHTLIGNCMIHLPRMPLQIPSLVKTFLSGMRKLSPKIVILVEEELFNLVKIPHMSFGEFFCEAIHHYTSLSDSLVSGFSKGYISALRIVEREFVAMRILDSVRQFPCDKSERKVWENDFPSFKDFMPIPLSPSNVSQAKFLVSLFGGGYWVQHEQCKLALCWKSRTLTTASIWVPVRSTCF